MSSGPALPHLYTCAASSAREGAAHAASRQRGIDVQLWVVFNMQLFQVSSCICWGRQQPAAALMLMLPLRYRQQRCAAAAATVYDAVAARHALQFGGLPAEAGMAGTCACMWPSTYNAVVLADRYQVLDLVPSHGGCQGALALAAGACVRCCGGGGTLALLACTQRMRGAQHTLTFKARRWVTLCGVWNKHTPMPAAPGWPAPAQLRSCPPAGWCAQARRPPTQPLLDGPTARRRTFAVHFQ